MDPNAALEQIRESVSTIQSDALPEADYHHALNRLAELVDGLDQWLSRDGFLPDDWKAEEDKPVPYRKGDRCRMLGDQQVEHWDCDEWADGVITRFNRVVSVPGQGT